MTLHDQIFGRWYEKSTDVKLTLSPGIHLLSARAFGLKGYIGGQHSWVAQVGLDDQHHVLELTDMETLQVQGATYSQPFSQPDDHTAFRKLIYLSNRVGGTQWFGADPVVWKTWPYLPLAEIIDIASGYPYHGKFHYMRCNCNTFVSWMAWMLARRFGEKFRVSPRTFIGAKPARHWRGKYPINI